MATTLDGPAVTEPPRRRDRTHWLYIAVVIAVLAGVAVGLLAPEVGKSVGVLGTMFVGLIKMMIAPVIFCTIVLGIGSVRKAATVGKVGGLAFVYFLVMSTFALAIGLVVGNLIHPGSGMHLSESAAGKGAELAEKAHEAGGLMDFVQGIIPDTLLSSLTAGSVLQALFVALLVGFALQAMGSAGEPILRGIEHLQKLVFKVLVMILWLAPIGAFGAIANVVGQTGWSAVTQLLTLMLAFYITCVVFVFGVLGSLLRAVSGISIFKLVRYLAREYLLIFSTSSSESALPRLIAKMEHLGVDRSTVGVVVPTGYSFNLDGSTLYQSIAAIFIAQLYGIDLSISQQLLLVLTLMVTSKGIAGVPGVSFVVLLATLGSVGIPLEGLAFIAGVDRIMDMARTALNVIGNALAVLVISRWEGMYDDAKGQRYWNSLPHWRSKEKLPLGEVSSN
jgi:aerobic C4-dicarboxylate transport protein